MIKQLQERKKALKSVRKRLDGNAPLHTEDGVLHMRCLAMLVVTEMQLESLQKDNEKDRTAMRPR